jgi:nitronate monooxygenase
LRSFGEERVVLSLQSPLTRRLGIDAPVVQAPIGSATCPELAAAVSDAGGLRTLAVTWRDPAEIAAAVTSTRRQTDGSVAANVVVDPDAADTPTDDLVGACLDADVDVLSLSFGDAVPYVDRAHDASVDVWQTVGSGAEARTAADTGVDAGVAQGVEADGHLQSDVSTMALVPHVVDAVDCSVVAAGGIGDGHGLAAVLALGADAGWLGTRFVATREARVHERYRRRVVEAAETDTASGTPYDRGWPGPPPRRPEQDGRDVGGGRPSPAWGTTGRGRRRRAGRRSGSRSLRGLASDARRDRRGRGTPPVRGTEQRRRRRRTAGG